MYQKMFLVASVLSLLVLFAGPPAASAHTRSAMKTTGAACGWVRVDDEQIYDTLNRREAGRTILWHNPCSGWSHEETILSEVAYHYSACITNDWTGVSTCVQGGVGSSGNYINTSDIAWNAGYMEGSGEINYYVSYTSG
jgi:hypothetical protein